MADKMNKQESKITVSVIKADIGGWVGHSAIHPALIEKREREARSSQNKRGACGLSRDGLRG